MSDVGKIKAARKAQREATGTDHRQYIAMEEAADSLEGIRQDVTMMAGQMTHLIQAISQLSQTIAVAGSKL